MDGVGALSNEELCLQQNTTWGRVLMHEGAWRCDDQNRVEEIGLGGWTAKQRFDFNNCCLSSIYTPKRYHSSRHTKADISVLRDQRRSKLAT